MKTGKYIMIVLAFFVVLTTSAHAQLSEVTTLHTGWCPQVAPGAGDYYEYQWSYTDSAGVHTFPTPTYTFLSAGTGKRNGPSCSGYSTSENEFSTDSAYYLTATGADGSARAGAMGFINPKYIVVGVTYAPPGSSSFVEYGQTTSVGSSTNISSSFTSEVGFSVSVSNSFGLPAGQTVPVQGGTGVKLTVSESTDYTQGSSSSTTNTISKASTIMYKTNGTPTFSPVSSEYDYIWLWLNPEIVFSYVPGSSPAILQMDGYALDPTDPASGEPQSGVPYIGGPDVLEVQVGCLDGTFSCPTTLTISNGVVTAGALARSWADSEYTWATGEGPALTTSDITNILSFDPLWPGNNYTLLNSLPSTTSDGRFSEEPFPPNDIQYPVGAGTEQYSNVQTDTYAVASGSSHSVKEAFGVSETFGTFLDLFSSTTTMTESETLTWTYSYLDTLTTTTTLTDELSITGPPDPPPTYTGPPQFLAYQDNLFGTFAFVPLN
jgi:hypothetical protein